MYLFQLFIILITIGFVTAMVRINRSMREMLVSEHLQKEVHFTLMILALMVQFLAAGVYLTNIFM